MKKILAVMLAAVMALSVTGCVQSTGTGNSVVEEKFETGVRTDGDDLVVNYEEDEMKASVRFIYTDGAVSDIQLVFITENDLAASSTYKDMTSGSSADEIAELYQDITLNGNKIICRMTDEIITNYSQVDYSKAELAEVLANQYNIKNYVEADKEETSAEEETTTEAEEEETTTEAKEEITTEAEEEEITTEADESEFKPSVVIDGDNVVCNFEQNGMINTLTYVFIDGNISEIIAVFRCEGEEIAEASYEMMTGSAKESFEEYYKNFELDGCNIKAEFQDEIVEMYQGVDQETIADLLRTQYCSED